MKKEKEIICLSQMTAKKGKEKKLKEALSALVEPSRKEPGCVAYELWQDLKNRRSFIMFELFSSKQALKSHVAMPYVQDFVKNEYKTCVESHWDADFNSV